MLDTIYRQDYTDTTSQGGGHSLVSALTEVQSFLELSNDEPLMPLTLFGRQRNQDILEEALERCFTNSEVVIIQGRSGCGKTTLAESLRPRALEREAYFVMSKFTQFAWSNVPYSAIVSAMTGLIESVLGHDDELEAYRLSVRKLLGDNIYLLTPLLPNLAQLAGLCGFESSDTHGIEHAFDRVKQSFCDLVRALESRRHPIVLLLDDLHFSDAASLDILKAILSGSKHLLLVCTTTQDHCKLDTELRTTEIPLSNLRESDAYFVTASLLQEDSQSISTLSAICYSKTNGNPYFLQQFLLLLQKKELLTRKSSDGLNKWTWNSGRVRDEAIISGNVLDVIEQLVGLLHPLIQHFLQIAACVGVDVEILEIIFDAMRQQKSASNAIHEILQVAASMGHQFQRMTTELIYGAVEQQISLETIDESTAITPSEEYGGVSVPNLPSIQVAVCLACAAKMGFLQIEGEERFKFTNNRVQQSISVSLGDSKEDKHLAMGNILRQHDKFNPGNPAFFFLVVDQLNAGSARITSDDAIVSLISLNVEAAVMAAEQSAFMSAQRYLCQALELQPHATMWEMEYELMLECCTLAAEMELACGNYTQANSYVDEVFTHAETCHDRHPAAFTKISSLIATGQIEEARTLTLQAVQDLGNKFPTRPKKAHAVAEVAKTKGMLSAFTDEQLLSLPPMVIASHMTEVKLLRLLSWCAFRLGDGEMLAVAALRIVRLTINNGFSDSAPYAFAMCGLVHSYSKNHKEASRFGHLSLKGLERVTDTHIKARTLLIAWSFVMHWSSPLAAVHKGSVKAYKLAQLSGDSDLAFSCALNTCVSSFLQGRDNLNVVIGYIRSVFDEKTNYEYTNADYNIYRIVLQAATNLSSHSYFPCKLTGEVMAEEIMLQNAAENQNFVTHYALWNIKLHLCAFFDQWELAEKIVDLIGHNHKCLLSHFSHLFCWMLSALSHTIRFNTTRQRKHRRAMKSAIKEFQSVVDAGVETCEAMFALLLAEESAAGGDQQVTMAAFDYAARCFGKENYVNFQALANERAARNMIRHFPKDAESPKAYLLKARTYYQAWGASCKVALLDEEIFSRWGSTPFAQTPRHASGLDEKFVSKLNQDDTRNLV